MKASPEDGATKESRQGFLLRYLERNKYVSVDDITRIFAVTAQTARRDLLALEQSGNVRRLHGGATLPDAIDPQTYRRRRIDNAIAKERIAETFTEMVPDGAALFIDTGTTCETIAAALLRRKELRVVTYSLRVAAMLSDNTDFTVAIPGGFVRQVDGAVFSEETESYIRRFKFDIAVISVSGVDSAGDLGDDDRFEVAAVKAAMEQAETVVLAVDHSKFGRRGLVRLGALNDVDAVVTDSRPPEPFARFFENGSVRLLC